jgi:hypothetical protein
MTAPYMKVGLLAVGLALPACLPAPAELCRQEVELLCRRQLECASDGAKADAGFQALYGSTMDDCRRKHDAFRQCDQKKALKDLCRTATADGGAIVNPKGGTYNAGRAAECADKTRAQTCEELHTPDKTPASCDEQCGPP